MPDISMCAAVACPKAEDCMRHAASGTVPSQPWQTYSAFAHGMDGCPSFWPKPDYLSPANPKGS